MEPTDHAVGRSRGGLTTKVHLAADGSPLSFMLTPGQAAVALTFNPTRRATQGWRAAWTPLAELVRVQRLVLAVAVAVA
ncbi:hypothetical protein QFZ67_000158 [Streptomyces sp. V1I1]|nr:hypothetical protein [Streptomyces sp. V1I1]